jgi:hypothetical protein
MPQCLFCRLHTNSYLKCCHLVQLSVNICTNFIYLCSPAIEHTNLSNLTLIRFKSCTIATVFIHLLKCSVSLLHMKVSNKKLSDCANSDPLYSSITWRILRLSSLIISLFSKSTRAGQPYISVNSFLWTYYLFVHRFDHTFRPLFSWFLSLKSHFAVLPCYIEIVWGHSHRICFIK